MSKPLEQLVAELNDQEEQQVKQPFVVTDLESAAEAQRRVTYFNDQKAEIDAIIEKQIAPFLAKIEKIKAWGEEAKAEHNDRIEHYTTLLEAFARQEIPKGKKKSIKLPYGSIALKKQQPEFERDEELLFNYAKANGFTKVKESTDWTSIKKKAQVVNGVLVDENGEVVPGVVVKERDDKFVLELEG